MYPFDGGKGLMMSMCMWENPSSGSGSSPIAAWVCQFLLSGMLCRPVPTYGHQMTFMAICIFLKIVCGSFYTRMRYVVEWIKYFSQLLWYKWMVLSMCSIWCCNLYEKQEIVVISMLCSLFKMLLLCVLQLFWYDDLSVNIRM